MDKKDFSNLEDQIRDTVNNAFNAIDFAKIKKDISSKTDDTINDVKVKLKYKSDGVKIKVKNKSQEFSKKWKTKYKINIPIQLKLLKIHN